MLKSEKIRLLDNPGSPWVRLFYRSTLITGADLFPLGLPKWPCIVAGIAVAIIVEKKMVMAVNLSNCLWNASGLEHMFQKMPLCSPKEGVFYYLSRCSFCSSKVVLILEWILLPLYSVSVFFLLDLSSLIAVFPAWYLKPKSANLGTLYDTLKRTAVSSFNTFPIYWNADILGLYLTFNTLNTTINIQVFNFRQNWQRIILCI